MTKFMRDVMKRIEERHGMFKEECRMIRNQKEWKRIAGARSKVHVDPWCAEEYKFLI